MTDYLVATSTVHVTAAACDYLLERATPEDAVTVLTVRESGSDLRDGEDALNVAEVRLATETDVETEARDGEPATEILSAAGDHDADAIVIGPWRGEPGRAGSLGSTARAVLEGADRPVVVVPLDVLS